MESPIVLDSSVWVEFYLGNARIRDLVIEPLRRHEIIVPTVCIYEVSLAVERRIGEDMVRVVVANMLGQVVDPLSAERAVAAAQIRNDRKLAMADAMVYASTLGNNAVLFTQDRDFDGLPNVRYLKPTY